MVGGPGDCNKAGNKGSNSRHTLLKLCPQKYLQGVREREYDSKIFDLSKWKGKRTGMAGKVRNSSFGHVGTC
jgi:hypothetical protein